MRRSLVAHPQHRKDNVRETGVVLIAAVFLLQTLFGSAVMLRMWAGATDPLGIAASICFGQPADPANRGEPDRGPGLPGYDHEQCLLCHAGLGPGTLPATVPLLAAPTAEAVALLPASVPMPSCRAGFVCLPRGPPTTA